MDNVATGSDATPVFSNPSSVYYRAPDRVRTGARRLEVSGATSTPRARMDRVALEPGKPDQVRLVDDAAAQLQEEAPPGRRALDEDDPALRPEPDSERAGRKRVGWTRERIHPLCEVLSCARGRERLLRVPHSLDNPANFAR
jgi:hypothetical protein